MSDHLQVTFREQNRGVSFYDGSVIICMNPSPCLSGHLRSSEFTWLSSSNNNNRWSVLLAWQVPPKTTRCWWIGVIRISAELCGHLSLLFTLHFSTAAFKMKNRNDLFFTFLRLLYKLVIIMPLSVTAYWWFLYLGSLTKFIFCPSFLNVFFLRV